MLDDLGYFKMKPTINEYKLNEISLVEYVEDLTKTEKRNNKKALLQVERYKEEVDELKEKNKELEKEIKNLKKEEVNIIHAMVKVLDEFNYALDFYKETGKNDVYENLLKTKKLIQKEVMEVGLNEIKSDRGDYISNRHNPISATECSDLETYQIIETVKRGYFYKDKLIREAQVIVAK